LAPGFASDVSRLFPCYTTGMRNPRCAYDAEGREIAPATVGSERAAGVREVEIWCGDCHHHAEISTDAMPAWLARAVMAMARRAIMVVPQRGLLPGSSPSTAEAAREETVTPMMVICPTKL
jgi:hypothetical protein